MLDLREQKFVILKELLFKTKGNMNTEIIVTRENGADSTFLRKKIEHMKVVLKASIQSESHTEERTANDNWIRKMTGLSQSIDPSIIDMSDEKTRYIMSK